MINAVLQILYYGSVQKERDIVLHALPVRLQYIVSEGAYHQVQDVIHDTDQNKIYITCELSSCPHF